MLNRNVVGSVMVVGGGIAGIQAALDLADSGYSVYMIEKLPSIGGVMAQLDKTFPTNDCSMCIISPKLVEASRHLDIKLFTMAEVEAISGKSGNFKVELKQNPRFVDTNKCIACGICADKCPKKVDDEYNQKLIKRKAIYLQYPQAVPLNYVIDEKNCIYFKNGKCRACEKFCPSEAINFEDMSRKLVLEVGSVILAPGFTPFDPTDYEFYNYSSHPNVLTSIEFERILSASGPCMGHLVRPSDNKTPKNIAWIQCVGSRDINNCDNGHCSSVCCMYANKQAVIAKEHSELPLDTTIFFMDMRTFGKDFDKYTIRSQEESGVRHIRSRIHSVFPTKGECLRIVYATESGGIIEEVFDLVVLSVGLSPNNDVSKLAKIFDIELDSSKYAKTSDLNPVATNRDGIYVCGAFKEPKDIPSSVVEASASAASASELLHSARWALSKNKELPTEVDVLNEDPRIGVFICNCGINIGGIADIPKVRDYAASLKYVVHSESSLFTCSKDSQEHIGEVIREQHLNRVVVASCSPRTHEALFQETIRNAGLNNYLFEMANIRDQNTWVHASDPDKATQKAKDLTRMAVAKVSCAEPLYQVSLNVTKRALVIGGGISGMEATLSIAEQGCEVELIEKSNSLGGNAIALISTWQGEPVVPYLDALIERIYSHPRITVHTEVEIIKTAGVIGNFQTTLTSVNSGTAKKTIPHGATIIATGAQESKPKNYLYGIEKNVLTHLDLDKAISDKDPRLNDAKHIAFIQCVGSRNDERPYCSKVCCTHSLKSAITLKEENPKRKITIIYRDMRSYGFREQLYKKAREKGILFIRYDLEKLPEVSKGNDGTIRLRVDDHVLRIPVIFDLDLLVLATGIIANENKKLYGAFKVPVNNEGFLLEAHAKLRPVDFASDGIFLAGLAHFPKPIEESIAQARASAARAMTVLSRNTIMVGGLVAVVDSSKCAACLTCVRTCPYGVPQIFEHSYASIETAQCHGCGVCAAECPGKAISFKHFTDEQLISKAKALFDSCA